MRDLNEILTEVRGKIAAACKRAGRNPDEVEIVAVTKTHGAEVVREAWDAGLTIIGENKVQEAMWKKNLCASGPSWHLIGHLQGNKVRNALETFDCIHSVDSIRLLKRINTVAGELGVRPRLLLEVNVSGEKSKSGMAPSEVGAALSAWMEDCANVMIDGFMTMAPYSENPEDARPYFRQLRELRDELRPLYGSDLPVLSMGMSGDYEVAVEEGATYVRLGTVLFGERPKLKAVRAEADDAGVGASGLDSYNGAGPTFKIMD